MNRFHGVTIVVDPIYGGKVSTLSERIHVWLADTPPNRAAAEQVWRTRPDGDLESGVTTFKVAAGASPEQWVLDILSTVLEHHGEYSHDPPLSFVDIIGVERSPNLTEALISAGLTDFTRRSDGWRATSPGA